MCCLRGIDDPGYRCRRYAIKTSHLRAGAATGEDVLGDVAALITAARGRIDNSYALPIVGTQAWRASFDLDIEGSEAVDLRCFLDRNGTCLSETWLCQYVPFRYPGEST